MSEKTTGKPFHISRRQAFKTAVALYLGATFSTITTTIARAYSKDGNDAYDWIQPLNTPGVPRSFSQSNRGKENAEKVPDYYTISLGSQGIHLLYGGQPCSVGLAGCTTFAFYNLFLKAGVIDGKMRYASTDDSEETYHKLYILSDKLVTSEGAAIWTAPADHSNGKIKYKGWAEGQDGIAAALKSDPSSLAIIHIESPLGMHWVYGEDVTDDGKIVIVDSGWGHHFLPAPSYSVVYGAHMYSMEGKKRSDVESFANIGPDGQLSGGGGGGENKDSDPNAGEHDTTTAGENAKPIEELDLDGMEGRKAYELRAERPDDGQPNDGRGFIRPDALDVPRKERDTLARMKEDQKATREGEIDSGFRSFGTLAGILGSLYAVAVMLAYVFDKNGGAGMTFSDRIAPRKFVNPEDEEHGTGRMFKFVIVVFILSVLLVTGLLPSIMGNIVNVLGDIWKNIGGR